MKDAVLMFFASLAIAFSVWSLCVSFSNRTIMKDNNTVLKEINSDSTYSKRDTLIDELVDLKFEKNAYIQFMDSQSNLIIGYVTLLFALFGITGLVISNRLAQHIKEDYQKKEREIQGQFRAYRINQDRKYAIHKTEILNVILDFKNEFTDLKYKVYRNLGDLNVLSAYALYDDNKIVSIERGINGTDELSSAFAIKNDGEIIDEILKIFTASIKGMDEIAKDIKDGEFDKYGSKEDLGSIDAMINKLTNTDIKERDVHIKAALLIVNLKKLKSQIEKYFADKDNKKA